MAGEQTRPAPWGGDAQSRRRLRVMALGSLLAAAVLAALVGVMTWELGSLARYEIRPSALHWIPAPAYLGVRRPAIGEGLRPLAELPRGGPDAVQITYLGKAVDLAKPPEALLALALSGQSVFFVNGVPTGPVGESVGAYLAAPGAVPRLFPTPAAIHRPGGVRYDLTLRAAPGRPLASSLYAGPEAVLRPVVDRVRTWTALSRPVLGWLGSVAALLGLGVGWVRRAPRPWLAIAAAAAAVGARAYLGTAANLETLGANWLIADRALLAAALISLLFAVRGTPADQPDGGEPGLALGARSALVATAVLAAGAASWGALAVFSGLWVVRLDVLYGLGAAASLSAVSVTAVVLLGGSAVKFARTQLDLSRLVRLQREELASKSQALDQEMHRTAVLEERQRLARDMHDGIGGQLVSLIARVRSRRVGIGQVERELVGGLAELRLVVDSLDATGETLAEALVTFRHRVQPQADAAGMELAWRQDGDLDVLADDPRWVLNIYRLLQEAISNAVAHSGGDRLEIAIGRVGEQGLRLSVTDNGKGLGDKGLEKARRSGGRGLSNMTFRANQIGGDLEFRPGADGRGTTIVVTLPVPEARAANAQSSGEMSPS